MSYIPKELRRQVSDRAGQCCEYCLLSREDKLLPFHIDHVIAEKHGGLTTVANLCLSCPNCNSFKGSDLSSLDTETGLVVPLFNPRKQAWQDHFRLNGVTIEPLTSEGRVTVFLLRLNQSERLIERQELIELGHYPCRKQ